MPDLTARNQLSIAQIIFYAPTLVISVYLFRRHGFGHNVAWFYLFGFAAIREASSALELATVSRQVAQNTDLVTAGIILQNVGVSPLMLVVMGLLGRVVGSLRREGEGGEQDCETSSRRGASSSSTAGGSGDGVGDSDDRAKKKEAHDAADGGHDEAGKSGAATGEETHRGKKILLRPAYLRAIQLLISIGLVLVVVAGVEAGDAFERTLQFVLPAEAKWGLSLIAASYGLLVVSTAYIARFVLGGAARDSCSDAAARRGRVRLLLSVALSLPFILVRVVYGCLATFTTDPRFNGLTGDDWIFLAMAVVMEMVVVAICVGGGAVVGRDVLGGAGDTGLRGLLERLVGVVKRERRTTTRTSIEARKVWKHFSASAHTFFLFPFPLTPPQTTFILFSRRKSHAHGL